MAAAHASSASEAASGWRRRYAWPRLRVVLIGAFLLSLPMLLTWTGSYPLLYLRLVLVGLIQLTVFDLFERWPRRLPSWLARWVLQVLAVALVVPFATAVVYQLTTLGDVEHWTHNRERMGGFSLISGLGILVTPWIAMAALYRQISGAAQRQALAFELERSELEHQASAARLRLLQAQVEPHFLFNTLANVRELVESGSPQAAPVLNSLIRYLRAAVPRLQQADPTLQQELELVRAYLEIMQMRMPDRLQYSLAADDRLLDQGFPAMALLTLVENAVRHGIDPSEQGGRIDVRLQRQGDRALVQVADDGVGLSAAAGERDGSGLGQLRQRLRLAFGDHAELRLLALSPRGTLAEFSFPLIAACSPPPP